MNRKEKNYITPYIFSHLKFYGEKKKKKKGIKEFFLFCINNQLAILYVVVVVQLTPATWNAIYIETFHNNGI